MSAESPPQPQKSLFGKERNPSHVLPEKLTLASKIKFRCHPGVSCFTSCCGHINIILTPYDILQLRKRLNICAEEFLEKYAQPTYIEKTDMPGVQIKLTPENRCPFVTPEGCTVYSDRPSACRYYPVGMANFHERAQEGEQGEQFFFMVKEDYCKGHEEEKVWTVAEWRADQGTDFRDEINRGWMELVMRRKSFGAQATLSEPAQKMFFMASTDLDKFRFFIFTSSFLDTYEIAEELQTRIKEDDLELLKFSYRYLAATLFGTQDLKIKPAKIQAKVQEMKEKQGDKAAEAEATYHELKEARDQMLAQKAAKG